MNSRNCKELLMDVTIDLINEAHGEVEKVTIRDIAGRSGVSVGLIHYHFGNKDSLITACVQRIIGGVVTSFRPDMGVGEGLPPLEAGKARLIKAAQEVFEFMLAHKSITRISVLGDYQDYGDAANSHYSLEGFSHIIGDAIQDEQEKRRIAFALICAMQVSFLRCCVDPHFLGHDLSQKPERDAHIAELVNQLMKE